MRPYCSQCLTDDDAADADDNADDDAAAAADDDADADADDVMYLGRRRCHTLYNPHLRLTLLTRQETIEGESYVRKDELEVRP